MLNPQPLKNSINKSAFNSPPGPLWMLWLPLCNIQWHGSETDHWNYLTPRSGQVITFHNSDMTWLIQSEHFNIFDMPVNCTWTWKMYQSLIIVFVLPQVCTLVFVVFVPVFPNTIRCLSCVNYWRSFPSKDCFKLWTHSKWDSNLSEWN